MKSAPILIDKIKRVEAFREFAYPDPASPLAKACRRHGIRARWGFEPAKGIIDTLPEEIRKYHGNPWTCGYGETKGVTYATRWSKEEAHIKLVARLEEFERDVLAACTLEPNPNQCAALVSFTYNVGVGNLRKSSVLRNHNAGKFQAAARSFALWNKAGGEVMAGLTARRAEEAALYLRPWQDVIAPEIEAEYVEPMSQQIEPERPMTQSHIMRASTVAGGTAALATVAETVQTVNTIKWGVDGLGEWLVPLLMLSVVALLGYIAWERYKQRKEGWA